jgi:hypothetical protein
VPGAILQGNLQPKPASFSAIYRTRFISPITPLIYLYTGWVAKNKIPMGYGLCVGVILFIVAIAIAYASLKWYDEPVRNWLKKRFLVKTA